MEINATSNWLITGGCGFIGVNLIDHLLKKSPLIRLRVLDNLSVGTREDLAEVCNFVEVNSSPSASDFSPNSVELVVGDICDLDTCLKCCEDVDIIVHLAANTGVGPSVENPRADMEANVIGTFNMLEASRQKGVDKFIFASSGAPIGEVEPPIHEEKAPKPVSPYGASKLAGEGYCSAYFRTFGLKTVSLRFGNVYGPRSKHKNSVVAKFFKQAIAGETLEIYGDGNQTRDFIYIDDLISAICLAIDPQPTQVGLYNDLSLTTKVLSYGETFQIATFRETTINEIIEIIKGIVESKTGSKIKVVHSEQRLGDVRRNYSDITKARKILGFIPNHDLYSGLQETFYFFFRKLNIPESKVDF